MAERALFRLIAGTIVPDGRGAILLVREGKPAHRGCWNLPGGHVEHGEALDAAAIREVREETGLTVRLLGLVGVFAGPTSVRFIFAGAPIADEPTAGDEILETGFFSPAAIDRLPDAELVRPQSLRAAISRGNAYPLSVVRNAIYPTAA